MDPKLRTFARYRPRFLTLALLLVIAILIALANLSHDMRRRGASIFTVPLTFDLREPVQVDPKLGIIGEWNLSQGWPFMWRQYVLVFSPGPAGVAGECHSRARLAANVAIWLAMLTVPMVVSEWFLRRHRMAFRWSVRAMLAAIGLAAALCACLAKAHHRAKLQDPVIASAASVWLEQWGPKWLDDVGAEHLCRRVVGADLRLRKSASGIA